MKILNKRGESIRTIKDRSGKILFSYKDEFDNLDGLNLSQAELSDIIAEGLCACRTDFTGANMQNADLYWAVLPWSKFTSANMKNVCLRGSDLKYTDFENANLRNTDFSPDNLNGCTQLQGVNFQGANVTGAKFNYAEYDETTIFPKGFDPDKFEMKKAKVGEE